MWSTANFLLRVGLQDFCCIDWAHQISQPAESIQSAPQGRFARLIALAALGVGVTSLAISSAPANPLQTTVPLTTAP
jgi:hypothetical protein